MKDLVSHQLVRYLEHRQIKHIFGLCGHTNIAFLSALENSSIRFINKNDNDRTVSFILILMMKMRKSA